MIATLLLMHVITATVIVGLLTTMAHPEARVKEKRNTGVWASRFREGGRTVGPVLRG